MRIKLTKTKFTILFILTFLVESLAIYFTRKISGITRVFTILSFTFLIVTAILLAIFILVVLKNMILDRQIAREIKFFMASYEKDGNLDKLFQNFKKIKDKPKTDYSKSLYYFNLAIAYVEDHQFQKAREVLNKSTLQQYNPSFNEIFKTLLEDIDYHEKKFNEKNTSGN
ncbi:hypothetical protein [uncultured Finegoldia sp.]|uniref:hypothetical protein n=1 Tax=uncultured Finegoldia sp. TaxID=328009 RepID=UPI00261AE822|nr:hypothetical protein [uncultured Finegoldia sp.]